ncbi:expressed unknown protein [Seminavis robusta]|uniref:Uncharacterized protein n=1 Tax=Seminavis robusta TaxID=568900 RepID=A0A9N8HL82_9STRA|nr:expressed unknown protein [Seminavis robusta]|eukprot:Sro895_g217260.1 n/a (160) ;mRNA; f:39428-39907
MWPWNEPEKKQKTEAPVKPVKPENDPSDCMPDPVYVSPVLAIASGAGIGMGVTAIAAPIQFLVRNGVAGGLYGLGLYSGMRFLHQEEPVPSYVCLLGWGAGFGSGWEAFIDHASKAKPQPWSTVAKAGATRSLLVMSLYVSFHTFLGDGKYSAHRDHKN